MHSAPPEDTAGAGVSSSSPASTPKTILVIQTAFLGDLVLTLPLFTELKQAWPEAKIHALVHARYARILDSEPTIHRVIPYDKKPVLSDLGGLRKLIRGLRAQKYDLAVVPHRSTRSAWLAFLSGAKRRVGYQESEQSWLFTDKVERGFERRPEPGSEVRHEAARNLLLLEPLGIEWSNPIPFIHPYPAPEDEARNWLLEQTMMGKSYATFAPGSVWETKRWPEEYWIELAKLLREKDIRVVLVGGKADRDLAARIAEASGAVSAAGEVSLLGSAELIRRADLMVTGDTAPLHIATAVYTKILAIFGPTVPEFGFGPMRESDRIVATNLDCRACEVHGSERCPLEHHRCMREITPDYMGERVLEMLTGGADGD
ncbi:lipopolysaccharide heptosyltransferase II [bacterium]|nr:lipopolysaccharide heptosyltransferase II [bacterium]